jgi:predicted TIM-barrel fold metal-dependent hydrolase
MTTIDADAHVIETERTWEYLEGDARQFRPVLSAGQGNSSREMWMIDGQPRGFRFPTLTEQELRRRSEQSGRDVVTALAAREMDDVELRLQDMDRLGIDVQVLHNTICIEQLTDRPEIDVALCRSWNRWLWDIWEKGQGRLLWSLLPPVSSIPDAIEEMRLGKAHGAVAVCMRPVEGDRLLPNEYFYPIYEEAQRLDLAIAVHIANGNPAMTQLYKSNRSPGGGFSSFRAPTVMACQQVLMSELGDVFPTLRWGFIEASANWVPWVVSDVRERYEVAGKPLPDYPLEANRVYVTCQTNDDLPFVLKHAGEHSIVIGTDYGHFDPSSELDAITVLKEKSGLPEASIHNILDANPRALYGL